MPRRLCLASFFALALLPVGCLMLTPAQCAEVEKCLPTGVALDTEFSPDGSLRDGRSGLRNITTVRRKLIELGAHCKDGKLYDAWGKEVFFYPVLECGNPMPGYEEAKSREAAELERL